jgi:hemerythrin superfamily protein
MTANNVFQIIKHDHQNIDRLFHEVSEAMGSEKAALVEALLEEISLHMKAEELSLYRALKDDAELQETLAASEADHAHVAQLSDEICELPRGDEDTIDRKLAELQQVIQAHVQVEEHSTLPRAGQLIDRERAEQLGDEMMAYKQRLDGEDDEGVLERRAIPPPVIETAIVEAHPTR